MHVINWLTAIKYQNIYIFFSFIGLLPDTIQSDSFRRTTLVRWSSFGRYSSVPKRKNAWTNSFTRQQFIYATLFGYQRHFANRIGWRRTSHQSTRLGTHIARMQSNTSGTANISADTMHRVFETTTGLYSKYYMLTSAGWNASIFCVTQMWINENALLTTCVRLIVLNAILFRLTKNRSKDFACFKI